MSSASVFFLIQALFIGMAPPKGAPHLPSVLQWNARGLRTRISELRREVLRAQFDVLALQGTNVLPLEGRISQYTPFHARTIHPSGRSRASLYIHVQTGSSEVDLSDLCTSNADYVAVTVNKSGFNTTVVGAYVWPHLHNSCSLSRSPPYLWRL